MIKTAGTLALWLFGAAFVFAGFNIHEPYVNFLHGVAVAIFLIAGFAVYFLIRRGYWRAGKAGRLLILLWCLPFPSMLYAHAAFEVCKRNVLHTDVAQAHLLGPHFVVGYTSFDEVAPLAEQGLIAGIYVARHNITGRTTDTLKSEIAALQERRRVAGLPPLIVAADQEGGIVSHLSPPLTELPALATLAGRPPDIRVKEAKAFGHIHGQELAQIGVNQNFAPVLDLRPAATRNRLDFNTLTGQRAISDDPATVAEIGLAYVRGLEASGVRGTVKHFPGLCRVRADTHHFSANLDAPLAELEAFDWRPFREVLAGSNAQLMIGHVTVTAIDPDRPASHSKRVVDGIIRQKWNFRGVVITDDLVMGAIYNHNVCMAVVEALNASVDLLLVAYDGSQFYRLFTCASDALDRQGLDMAMLHDSEVRLKQALPAD
ncbi:glycoside hydrolase family 3 N-terminal domain-containing protein [Bradyrhizobium sp. dw_411]|uniref:glycoside hydrolase family 3 N-terminal domain-containing protein n=1 Tax=Bradyrhizobium sp. dw_411 TaxID=2720082 RepID=UPI001BCFD664|nr:glycoside hydrolase family 3 N-terminal domain-containing protein [Bradyrhizobium sp. dw_411]